MSTIKLSTNKNPENVTADQSQARKLTKAHHWYQPVLHSAYVPCLIFGTTNWHWCRITWPCEHLVIGEIIVVGVSGHKLIYHGTYLHLRDLEIKYIIIPIYLKSRKAIKIIIHKLFVTSKCWKRIYDCIIIRWSLIKKWSNIK